MKKCLVCLLIAAQLMMIPSVFALKHGETLPDGVAMQYGPVEEWMAEGKDFLLVPEITIGQTEVLNTSIREKAQITAYENIMTFGTGSAGLQVYPDVLVLQGNILSLAISANGKMPVGRPSQVYYPMTFDVDTGEEIPFEAWFKDADGAMAYMEEKTEAMEENLSTHLENRSLIPVPFDRYTVDEWGNMTIWYEKDQLSFLSGFSGALHFRHSELSPYFDDKADSLMGRLLTEKEQSGWMAALGDRNCLGWPLDEALSRFRSTVDSEYYPGGAFYEVEDAKLQGTVLLTDNAEETVLGLLAANLDDGGIVTGKTTLTQARELLGNEGVSVILDEETALQYRVCAGESVTYRKTVPLSVMNQPAKDTNVAYTLYADENQVIRYIRLMIEQ